MALFLCTSEDGEALIDVPAAGDADSLKAVLEQVYREAYHRWCSGAKVVPAVPKTMFRNAIMVPMQDQRFVIEGEYPVPDDPEGYRYSIGLYDVLKMFDVAWVDDSLPWDPDELKEKFQALKETHPEAIPVDDFPVGERAVHPATSLEESVRDICGNVGGLTKPQARALAGAIASRGFSLG